MQTYKIQYRKRAINHIEKSSDWYDTQKEGLGKEFRNEVTEHINKYLTTFPKFAIIYKNIRKISLKQFSHDIFFVVDEQKQNVKILAVIHHKQFTKYRN
jgi:hypothetical protein